MHIFTNPLALFVAQAIVVVTAARALSLVTRRVQQPMVIAEITAGIVLGPSVLGALAPSAAATLFPKSSMQMLSMTSQLGVLLFMFIVGLELHPRLLRGKAHQSVAISHASIVLPFVLGAISAVYLQADLAPAGVGRTSFILFMGASMSITAFPVLARILVERRLLRSRVGATAISCAAVDDVTAWFILAFVVSIVRSTQISEAITTVVLALGYIALMIYVVRPLLARFASRTRVGLNQGLVAVILVLMLTSAWLTELIGIHALFGAFLFGAILPKDGTFASALSEKIEDVVIVLLLPLFFAYSGLRTELGLLDTASSWLTCGLIILLASVGKFGGSALAARITGFSWREASAIGILMNTRGLMELIVLNIGLDLGVISPKLFTMMVIMALVTTFVTTPVLAWVYPIERFKAELTKRESSRTLEPRFTALACLAEESSAPGLVTLAVALTGPTSPDARVYALRLFLFDERASPLIAAAADDVDNDLRADVVLDAALTRGRALQAEVRPLSFVSSEPVRDIREVAEVKRADIVLLGWQRPGAAARSRSLVEAVLEAAPCDVGILVDRNFVLPRRVLVAFAGGEADQAALRVASRLATGAAGHVTVLVVSSQDNGDWFAKLEETARRALGRLAESRIEFVHSLSPDPRKAVATKSAEGYDLLVMSIGASWGVEPHSFALSPQRVVDAYGCSVMLVRGGEGAVEEEEVVQRLSTPAGSAKFASLRPPA